MGPRVFSPREASALIPQLESILDELDRIRGRLRQVKTKVDVLEMLWGDEVRTEPNPDNREYSHYMEEIERSKKEFDAATEKIADLEGLLKSAEQGLVDFYGVIEGRLVFLCWKHGEKAIEFYHHLEEGFAGRQPIPAEELAR
jgi:hypothetical protein